MAEVIGAAFLGITKYIKDSHGKEILEKIIEQAGEAAKEAYGKKIITVVWYPYEAYIHLLRAADKVMGSGDLTFARELGIVAAKKDFDTVYSMYKEKADPQTLINDSGLIWKSYYRDAGKMEAASSEPDNTILRIYDFPEMAPAHCRLMEGWMTQTMRLLGANLIEEVRETQCASEEAPYHEFKTRWSERAAG